MTEYSEQLINTLSKRFATDRLSRGDSIRLGKNPKLKKIVEEKGGFLRGKILAEKEASGKASKKVLAQIGELTGHALRGYNENKGTPKAKKPAKDAAEPSAKLSKLVHAMTSSPDATTSMMAEVLRRELTLVEFAARLEVAPATLTKTLSMIGLSYEKFRDATLASGVPVISMLLDSLTLASESFRSVGEEGISQEKALRVAEILGAGREQILRYMNGRAPASPATAIAAESVEAVRAATPSTETPKSLEGWRDLLSVVDLGASPGFERDARFRELATRYLAWTIAQREQEGSAEIVAQPWAALVGYNKETDSYPNLLTRQLVRFAAMVIEIAVQAAPEPEWDGNSLLRTLVWLVESGAEGSARALTAACFLSKSVAISTYARDVRSKVINALRDGQLKIPNDEYKDLVSGADRNAA